MGRYQIRDCKTKECPISTDNKDINLIKQDIDLLHFYDNKIKAKSIYEVYDTKCNKVIYKEG